MKYTTILFDLDGTITDSGEGIINSVSYALEKMKLPIPNKEQLYSFIGPPLNESFRKLFSLDEPAIEQAVSYYRENYQIRGMYENHVYDGITELLNELKSAGCQLYIATSKPEVYAKQILAHFDLDAYFAGIYGASLDGNRSKKGDVIRYALSSAKITSLEKTVMIGDRSHDIIGAKENQLDSLGVLYGFGDHEELTIAGADHLAKNPKEIANIILEK
ncbi:HAD family hydrolase [Enterococcus wangshanyuanii]|uniref:5'-nucleotidase n=1 Tax=Enterococcus wangshanyuanii TaxID=2005703 RepID=A0ABQ1PQC0_9ENTE|nr:HAD family hydrolase [Enterococcus wangshanyuanii]GGD01370.1 5'-nucleotidase [Enterococcus wangshanyuanii]